ncbi:response regulator [Sulfitobacter sp.]|nr:response regulator [bacterium]MDC0136043.1 response regulator [Sulfitobacter sp.]
MVDDNDFDRSRLKKLCRAFDFTTHAMEASSLRYLRDRLKKDRFDLILLDYHLNDGTGLEGVDIIRADAVNCTAATVMITGTEQNDIAVQALKLGFSDYLTKDEISQ